MIKQELTEDLICSLEGLLLVAEKDNYGVINIGYGLARTYLNGSPIKIGDKCTKEQAIQWLRTHLEKNVYPHLELYCRSKIITNRVYAGLCSFVYNVGIVGTSLVRAISDNDLKALYDAFMLYNKIRVNGVLTFSQGLENRRIKEINFMKENG